MLRLNWYLTGVAILLDVAVTLIAHHAGYSERNPLAALFLSLHPFALIPLGIFEWSCLGLLYLKIHEKLREGPELVQLLCAIVISIHFKAALDWSFTLYWEYFR